MQILLVCGEISASHGGIQRFNQALIQALGELSQDLDYHVRVLSLNDSYEVSAISVPNSRLQVEGFFRRKANFAFQVLRASREADLLLFGHVNLLPLGLITPYIGGSSKHAVILHGEEAWRRLPWQQRLPASRFAGLIAVSNYTSNQFCQVNRVIGPHIFHLPNTLDSGWIDCLIEITPERKIFKPMLLTVSRLDGSDRLRYKGIDHVIMSLPLIIKDFPSLKYVIVGDGTDRSRLENLTCQLNLREYIEFTGFISDEELKLLYRKASVFILPSAKEGFGIVYLEAMAHGLPIIAANSGGAPEVVIDGKTGILVPFGGIKSIAQAISILLSNQYQCIHMGKEGREYVKKEFTYPKFKERVDKIIRQLAMQ